MNDKIDGWDGTAAQEPADPYDNHADIRRELGTEEQSAVATTPISLSQAEAILASVMNPAQPTPSPTENVLAEAVKRIEQAKLYEILLKHNLFGDGSARPEIIESVQAEIRDFALNRLEVLLGMKAAAAQTVFSAQVAASQFSEEEAEALKALAARMLKKEAPNRITNPQIIPVGTQSSATPLNEIRAQMTQAATAARPQAAAPAPQPRREPSAPRRPRRSQAVNPRNRPIPMPSNDVMNAQNAIAAAKNAEAIGSTPGPINTALNQSMARAIKTVGEGE